MRQVMLKNTDTVGLVNSENSALVSRTTSIGSNQNQQRKRPWCYHYHRPGHIKDTCWEIHGKPENWKPKQKKPQGYQAAAVGEKTLQKSVGNVFGSEQLEQLRTMFSNFQKTGQPSTSIPSGSLAHRGSIIYEDDWQC